jgi:hypothetical protein
MAKPNAKTLQERMGFTDPDLKTPGHDAIMMWLDDQVKISLQERLGIRSTWTAKEISDLRDEFGLYYQREYHRTPPDLGEPPTGPTTRVMVKKTTWEPPVKNEKGFELGFIDMRA